jgi:hypothetical protein
MYQAVTTPANANQKGAMVMPCNAGVLGRINEDHVLEEIAVQHGLDGHETDQHRRNRQEHQGNSDHPG